MALNIPVVSIPQFSQPAPYVPDFDPFGSYYKGKNAVIDNRNAQIRNRLMDMYLREQEDRQNFMKMQAGYIPQDTQISIPQEPIMPPEVPPQYPGIGDRGPNALLEQNTAPIEQPPLQYTIPGDPVNPAAADRYPVQAMQFRQDYIKQQQDAQKAQMDRTKSIVDIWKSIPPKDRKTMLPILGKTIPEFNQFDADEIVESNNGFVAIPVKDESGNVIGHAWVDDKGGVHPISETKDTSSIKLIRDALREKLGREPTANEILAEQVDQAAEMSGAKAMAGVAAAIERSVGIEGAKKAQKSTDPYFFPNWTEGAKKNAIYSMMISGKPPRFAYRDPDQWNAFQQAYYQYLDDHNITPSQIARMQADVRAKDKSFSNQEKIYAPLRSFIKNLDTQIGRVRKAYDELGKLERVKPGSTARLQNMLIRNLNTVAAGKGEEASVAMLLLEIANESAKISTGSSASIREISAQQAEKWDKIHDKNMSVKDMFETLNTTYRIGQDRMASVEEAKNWTLKAIEGQFDDEGRIRDVPTTKMPEPEKEPVTWQHGPGTKKRDITPAKKYLGGAKNDADFERRVIELKNQGWTSDEIKEAIK